MFLLFGANFSLSGGVGGPKEWGRVLSSRRCSDASHPSTNRLSGRWWKYRTMVSPNKKGSPNCGIRKKFQTLK